MKRLLLPVIFLLTAAGAFAKGVARPKLVVGIVVDQMRWDYLYRYYSHFGQDGFRRLMDEGFRCEQAMINYLPTFTAPGHTCIYTGSVPAIHGIAGNDWIEGGKAVYCTDDKTVMPVGGSMRWGQMSPRSLLTTTVTDELRLATNFRSRVYGVSLKDRSSIFPAGHLANGAYWFDDSTGAFSTSTYYCKALPEWVARFNTRHPADSLLARDWNLSAPAAAYTESAPDSMRYEGKFAAAESGTRFPHRAAYFAGKGGLKYNTVRKLPAGASLTFQFAERCIAANDLGGGADPDFLCVSISSTDYTGHQFGPNAQETEDTYIRLDADLARFFAYLDERVGEGGYTVFLTADHGVAHNSLFLEDHRVPAGNVSEAKLRTELNAFLKGKTGKDSLVRLMENYQVYLDESRIPAAFNDRLTLRQTILSWLRARPEVSYAIDLELSALNAAPEPIHTMAINGYYKPRCGVIQIILKPGYYSGYAPTGTTHGTWNPYDTHIPLLWYGWGVRRGETYREVHMTDIAPTLSALLHIQMPDGCVGKVIGEVLR